MKRIHVLEREQLLPRPPAAVFPFFEDAANLERITPPALRFRIVTPMPIAMGAGTLIDYRLRLFGLPFTWRTHIELYEPPHRFVDTQLRGPYALWRHLHTFEAADGGRATRMRDRVEYALPFGPLGEAAHALLVRRTLARIFDHRRDVVAEVFSPGAPAARAIAPG